MDLVIAFIIFIASMIAALITGYSMVWALLIGLVLFTALGLRRKYSLKDLSRSSWGSIKDSLVVIEVMFIIGFITAAWRVSGTITVFVYYGMNIIIPPMFLVITFLLTCLLSYALGTSFGVAGTLGVIFMALARSGGVDPVITAGVIMSGIYFGDRGSPVSSSANMVAGITKTNILDNVKLMMRTGALPMAMALAAYIPVSIMNPISHVDPEILQAFREAFTLSPWAFVPAILMLVLPLCKVGVILSILISIASSVVVAFVVEKVAILEILKILVLGYHASGDGLGAILNGGGMISMLEVVIILIISCAYSGIFNLTGMLNDLLDLLTRGCRKIGRYGVTVCVSIVTCMMFCNQTIASLMCKDLLTKPYLDTGGTRQELAIDMENTVIVIVGLIPWCIACSVPLTFMNVGIECLPWAFYMYLIPICYGFTKRHWFANREGQNAKAAKAEDQ